jgi:flagellar protein FlgJ
MADIAANAGVYTDFAGFAKLKADARAKTPEALEKTAKQFESLFTQMLLKSMRATSFGDDGLGAQGDIYKDMFDQQLSLAVSAGKGLGIADVLVSQLRRMQGETQVSGKAADHRGMTLPGVVPARASTVAGSALPAQPVEPAATNAEASATAWPPAGPREFLEAIWPHALRAAKAIGVSAKTLVAQAALETGWGKHVAADDSGKSTFNLFGIKASAGWSGDKVERPTTEVVGGVERKERANFRAYDSLSHAFDDYVAFVRDNPRYADALRASPHNYAAGLQKAGYATDPQYAAKIQKIELSL